MEKTGNPNQPNPNNKKPKPTQEYLKYSGLAFQMMAVILLGLWLGNKIDKWAETQQPIFTIIAVLIAVILSLVVIIISAYKSK